MTELLYQKDAYLRECEAEVVEVFPEGIVTDRTIFMPRSGGLEGDRGKLIKDGKEYSVAGARFVETGVLHLIENHDLVPGDVVRLVIDWESRYRQMRLHTAAHILSALFYRRLGAMITGGHITPEKAYDDYSLESIDKGAIEEIFAEANDIVKKDLPVKVYWLPREEALKIPEIVKLASRMPPNIERWRIVEIPGVDIQADGGVHVQRTGEIGEIVLVKLQNKGRNRKRVYFTVRP